MEEQNSVSNHWSPRGDSVFYNVPSSKDPQLHTEEERQAQAVIMRRRAEVANHLEKGGFIDFQSDRWDFRKMYPGRPGRTHVLLFDGTPTPKLKRIMKYYLRYAFEEEGTRPSTLYSALRILKIITSRIVKAPRAVHDDLDLITTEDIFAACVKEGTKPSTRRNYLTFCFLFWRYCIEVCGMDLPVSVDALRAWSLEQCRLAKLEENKIPDIPEEYFQEIFKACLSVIRADRKSVPYNDVLVAGTLIILSQTGMRIGDALSLTTDGLHSVVLDTTGETVDMLRFRTSKPTRGQGLLLEADIFASPVCAEAFRRLLDLRKSSPSAENSHLLILPQQRKRARTEPYNFASFRGFMQGFFLRNLPVLSQRPWEGIKPQLKIDETSIGRPKLWIPTTHQYRVHLCSYLYRKGVSIIVIEKQLAHLSESMYGYYIRLADERARFAEFGEEFIEDYFRRGYVVVEENGAKVQQAVLKMLKDKKVSVKASSDEILAALNGAVTVRQKGAGYCVRASFTPCNDEPNGNRLLCTYGMCANYVTMFHAADASLRIFRDHMTAYGLNLAAGHRNAAAKELSDAKEVARRHLSPQLRALEMENNRLGWDEILRRHPHLEYVVFNLAQIKREVAEAMALEVERTNGR